MGERVKDAGRAGKRYRFWFTVNIYLLLLLPVGLLTLFVYVPVVWGISGSFYAFEIGAPSRFVGLSNYTEIFFNDPVIYPSILHMLFLTTFLVCVRLTFPLVVAKLIYSLNREKSKYVFRILFLVPIVVPGVAVQLIWMNMIYADRGMLNELLSFVGLEQLATGWLSNPTTALIAVAFVGFPWVGGVDVLIYYAGFTGIPESVNEAARLEGCTGIQKFFRIDIPMVLSQIKLILILTLIAGVQSYEGVLIMTRGGPGFETTVPGLWMYLNAFSFQRMGYACAIGVCLFVLIFGLTFLAFRYFKSTEQLEGRG